MIALRRRSFGVPSKLRHGEDFKKIKTHGASKRLRPGQRQALLRAWADESLDQSNQGAIEEKIAEKAHPHNLSTQLAWISRMKRQLGINLPVVLVEMKRRRGTHPIWESAFGFVRLLFHRQCAA